MWCFLLPVAIIVFAFLVTDKWWVGTLLLVIAIIGCITVVLLRKWLFKQYHEALKREQEESENHQISD